MSSGISEAQRVKIVQEVFQCFQKALEIIVSGRQGCRPTEDSITKPAVSERESERMSLCSHPPVYPASYSLSLLFPYLSAYLPIYLLTSLPHYPLTFLLLTVNLPTYLPTYPIYHRDKWRIINI